MNDHAQPTIGHNIPPPPSPLTPDEIVRYLDFALDSLLTRRREVIVALEATAQAHARIDDDDTLSIVADNMNMAGALARTAERRRVEEKAPLLAGERAVEAWFRRFLAPLNVARAPVQEAMNEYGVRVEAQRRAEAEAEAARAEAEAVRAANEAAALLQRNASASARDAALEAASNAGREADRASTRAIARPAAFTRTTSLRGTTTSLRTNWKWRVVNAALIPRQYLSVNADAIKVAAKTRDASGKPVAVIPGVEFYADKSMGVK